jgi:hypothetical protein
MDVTTIDKRKGLMKLPVIRGGPAHLMGDEALKEERLMSKRVAMNDGTGGAPRLELQQSWWAMTGVGNGTREWTMEEKFERIAEAGFRGILGRLPVGAEAERWRRLLDEYSFSFGIHSFPSKVEDLDELIVQAKDFGVSYINSQVMDSFTIGAEAIQLLQGLISKTKEAGIPYFVETHRGRVTQDLHRTVEYVQALPELRLTIDLSHYIVAGELTHFADNQFAKADQRFQVLLQRTSCIHARISNGEQVQVEVGPNGEHPLAERYMAWWEKGMSEWLKQAEPGDVLPFVPELGPPPYAILKNSYAAEGPSEISDRWEQALVLKRMGESTWNRAVAAEK